MHMIKREASNHVTDCYFCMVKFAGISFKTITKIAYFNLPSAIEPIFHSKYLLDRVFQTLTNEKINEDISDSSTKQDADDNNFAFSQNVQKLILFNQDA